MCTCAGIAPGFAQHEDWCGRDEAASAFADEVDAVRAVLPNRVRRLLLLALDVDAPDGARDAAREACDLLASANGVLRGLSERLRAERVR